MHFEKKESRQAVVALPMASSFNEKVAIDLNHWKGKYILHIVDMYSRLTISCFIDRKKPREVIDKLMEKWIGYFGVMRCILNDNGGEFTAEEIREFKSILILLQEQKAYGRMVYTRRITKWWTQQCG